MATATATATHVDLQDLRARSLELAEARGETVCSWHAHSIGMTLGEDGQLINAAWRVESATDSDREYVVTYQAAGDHAVCECHAAQFGHACWHAGLGLMIGRSLQRLYSPAGQVEAERQYQRDLAHEGNATALGY